MTKAIHLCYKEDRDREGDREGERDRVSQREKELKAD